MVPTQITPQFYLSAQPQATDFGFFSGAGITLIINNRPDDEDSSNWEPPRNQMLHKMPSGFPAYSVTAATLSEACIRTFQSAISGANGPVLAHCKTGTRSLTLWVLGEVQDGRMTTSEVVPFGRRFGFDLTTAALWLAKRAEKGTQ